MMKFEYEWKTYKQRARGRVEKQVDRPGRIGEVRQVAQKLPPTPQIKARGKKIEKVVERMQTQVERKNENKLLLGDIQQGWEEKGASSTLRSANFQSMHKFIPQRP